MRVFGVSGCPARESTTGRLCRPFLSHLEFLPEELDLLAGLLERAGVVDHPVSLHFLFLGRPLGVEALLDRLRGESVPGRQPFDLLFAAGRHHDNAVQVERLRARGIQQQWNVDDHDGVRGGAAQALDLLQDAPADFGVGDRVEPTAGGGIAEDELTKGLPVERPIAADDRLPKGPDNLLVRLGPGCDGLPRDVVGFDDDGTQVTEHLGNGRHPGGDAPGQPEDIHASGSMSRQLGPVCVSTRRGTLSGKAWAMTRLTSAARSPTAARGTSKSSSSWTCRVISAFEKRGRTSRARSIIAFLMMSALRPWMGVLIAVRSAASRIGRLRVCTSGMYRRRFNTVVTNPVRRACSTMSSIYWRTLG